MLRKDLPANSCRAKGAGLARPEKRALLISALKSKLFPAEDRQPKNVIFG
jgi:hypothetical protein